MKRLTTMVFAALVAVTLSVPAWAQTPAPAPNSQTKTTEKQSKDDKKQASKAKKDKKSKKQASKDAKKNPTNATK